MNQNGGDEDSIFDAMTLCSVYNIEPLKEYIIDHPEYYKVVINGNISLLEFLVKLIIFGSFGDGGGVFFDKYTRILNYIKLDMFLRNNE